MNRNGRSPPFLANTYLFKVNNKNNRKKCETCWCCSGVFIVNFEHISHLFSGVSIVNFDHVNVSLDYTFSNVAILLLLATSFCINFTILELFYLNHNATICFWWKYGLVKLHVVILTWFQFQDSSLIFSYFCGCLAGYIQNK